jgi:hypothetical protein
MNCLASVAVCDMTPFRNGDLATRLITPLAAPSSRKR